MKKVLITWDSINHGFVVTAKTIRLLMDNNVNIDEIIYLHNQNLSERNLFEKRVFYKQDNPNKISKLNDKKIWECEQLADEIQLEYKLPKFIQRRVHINSVTDYQSIYDKIRDYLQELNFNNIQLHINVSPGTPQMHVIWLMLNSSGLLPYDTVLWSSQFNKETQETTLNKIKFKPKTFLSELFDKNYKNSLSIQINPNNTKSKNRKLMEEKLDLFLSIPNIPILILGERGTGKSTYVRNFMKVDSKKYKELACGTFSDELLRAELFGYKKGAFTGANSDKEGILDTISENGLLFLDEIQDLSQKLQRQLMQVLQTGQYFPIGSTVIKVSKFKLVVASNLPYLELCNKLDPDFLDRIARFIIEVPPVRDCLDDIEFYWKNVWKEISNFEGAPAIIWNDRLKKFIESEYLYGNFRDLQKLASYILAYKIRSHKSIFAIEEAIVEYNKWKIQVKPQVENNYFQKGESYNNIIANFNKDLAEWAIAHYGNKKKASLILARSVSSLSKDITQERLRKK